jgi:hypothetical protein
LEVKHQGPNVVGYCRPGRLSAPRSTYKPRG